jgi:hypothetical protein
MGEGAIKNTSTKFQINPDDRNSKTQTKGPSLSNWFWSFGYWNLKFIRNLKFGFGAYSWLLG